MILLKKSAASWGTDAFSATLRAEMEGLRSDVLPIAHVIGPGNRLDDSDLGVIVNAVSDDGHQIRATIGVFFAEVVACATCSGSSGMCDEAYCELTVTVDKTTGEAHFAPLQAAAGDGKSSRSDMAGTKIPVPFRQGGLFFGIS